MELATAAHSSARRREEECMLSLFKLGVSKGTYKKHNECIKAAAIA